MQHRQDRRQSAAGEQLLRDAARVPSVQTLLRKTFFLLSLPSLNLSNRTRFSSKNKNASANVRRKQMAMESQDSVIK
jgi:hypothetical protein